MKLPEHVNKECFEKMRLHVREYGMESALTSLVYLCSYSFEHRLLDTLEHILKARDAYIERYKHKKENCVAYNERSLPCPDCIKESE